MVFFFLIPSSSEKNKSEFHMRDLQGEGEEERPSLNCKAEFGVGIISAVSNSRSVTWAESTL